MNSAGSGAGGGKRKRRSSSPEMPRGPNEPHRETLFDHKSVQGRKDYIRILRQYQAESNGKFSLERWIPPAVVAHRRLPYAWLEKRRRPIRTFYQVLSWQKISSGGDRPSNFTLRRLLDKIAQVHSLYNGGRQESTDVLNLMNEMLPNIHEVLFDDHPNSPSQEAHKYAEGTMSRLISEVGMSILYYILDRESFYAEPLPPFGNEVERQVYIRGVLSQEPMLLISWLNRACPALDLAFIFGNNDWKEEDDIESLEKYQTEMRRFFRCFYMVGLDVTFQGMLNVDPRGGAIVGSKFGKFRRWVTTNFPSAYSFSGWDINLDNWPVRPRLPGIWSAKQWEKVDFTAYQYTDIDRDFNAKDRGEQHSPSQRRQEAPPARPRSHILDIPEPEGSDTEDFIKQSGRVKWKSGIVCGSSNMARFVWYPDGV